MEREYSLSIPPNKGFYLGNKNLAISMRPPPLSNKPQSEKYR
jgi:hypothetical protein